MFRTLRAVWGDPEGKVLLASAIVTLSVGTVAYMLLEGWSVVDALYFSVVTLATVGYGDLHPTTEAARLFTIAYILTGIGILAAFVSELARYRETEGGFVARRLLGSTDGPSTASWPETSGPLSGTTDDTPPTGTDGGT
jgi:voltage-gated potassium channel